jgi:hypothetical protein
MSIGKQNERYQQNVFLNREIPHQLFLLYQKHHDDYSSSDMIAGNEAHFVSKCSSETS